jgi:hypothetical protein
MQPYRAGYRDDWERHDDPLGRNMMSRYNMRVEQRKDDVLMEVLSCNQFRDSVPPYRGSNYNRVESVHNGYWDQTVAARTRDFRPNYYGVFNGRFNAYETPVDYKFVDSALQNHQRQQMRYQSFHDNMPPSFDMYTAKPDFHNIEHTWRTQ